MSQKISPLHSFDGSLNPSQNARAEALVKSSFVRPNDEVYAAMLNGFVRNCVDSLVLTPNDQLLMGYRVNEPRKGHWHPSGGGQALGQSYEETAAAHLKRDLGIVVHPARFAYINSASFPWTICAQGVPCHMNGILMAVQLTDEEVASHRAPKTGDFAKAAAFNLTDVTVENGFHPAIVLGTRIMERNRARYGRLGTIDPDLL